jgi:ABC-2 type transport system ATP-binding protein
MVGFMPDFFGVYENMKSWEYLDFFGRAYGVPAARRAASINELLELVDLSHKRNDNVMALSRGMKQRLSLARAMMLDPRVLILDEPASGLDPRARSELREQHKELAALGKTIMISSHILTELAEMCTHIAIIEQGKLLASGEVDTILRSLQPHVTLEVRVLHAVDRAEQLLRGRPDVLAVRRAGAGATVETIHDAAQQDGEPVSAVVDVAPPVARREASTLLVDFAGDEQGMGELLARLVGAGVVITRFAEQRNDLEDIFMQVTKGLVQ